MKYSNMKYLLAILFTVCLFSVVSAVPMHYFEGDSFITATGEGFVKLGGNGQVLIDTKDQVGKIIVHRPDNLIIVENYDPTGWMIKRQYGDVTKIFIRGQVYVQGDDMKVEYVTGPGEGEISIIGNGWAKFKGYWDFAKTYFILIDLNWFD